LPASGGIASARGLAGFYASLARDGARSAMTSPLVNGPDLVLCTPTSFSAGFMLDPRDATGRKIRQTFGPSPAAFGHPGAGGVHAFVDPENGLAFAYVMNQMELGVFPNRKSLALMEAIYAEQ
jgi:CubicO group peptidase (beta-lactamase class C family)